MSKSNFYNSSNFPKKTVEYDFSKLHNYSVDFLKVDPNIPKGQNYFIVSFLEPHKDVLTTNVVHDFCHFLMRNHKNLTKKNAYNNMTLMYDLFTSFRNMNYEYLSEEWNKFSNSKFGKNIYKKRAFMLHSVHEEKEDAMSHLKKVYDSNILAGNKVMVGEVGKFTEFNPSYKEKNKSITDYSVQDRIKEKKKKFLESGKSLKDYTDDPNDIELNRIMHAQVERNKFHREYLIRRKEVYNRLLEQKGGKVKRENQTDEEYYIMKEVQEMSEENFNKLKTKVELQDAPEMIIKDSKKNDETYKLTQEIKEIESKIKKLEEENNPESLPNTQNDNELGTMQTNKEYDMLYQELQEIKDAIWNGIKKYGTAPKNKSHQEKLNKAKDKSKKLFKEYHKLKNTIKNKNDIDEKNIKALEEALKLLYSEKFNEEL